MSKNNIIVVCFQHGTCPICRKSLGDDGIDEHQSGSGASNMGPSLAALFRYSEAFSRLHQDHIVGGN